MGNGLEKVRPSWPHPHYVESPPTPSWKVCLCAHGKDCPDGLLTIDDLGGPQLEETGTVDAQAGAILGALLEGHSSRILDLLERSLLGQILRVHMQHLGRLHTAFGDLELGSP